MASVRAISLGGVTVGGGAPVAVQSMTCTDTADAAATLAQIHALAQAGCELVRVALPSSKEMSGFAETVAGSPLPVIADVHFDWRLAIAALEAGAAGVRINPGTMVAGKLRAIVEAAEQAAATLRIGVNAGSLPRRLRDKACARPADALVEAALDYAGRLEEWGFRQYKISVKSSSVPVTVQAYRLLAERSDAPLHVGVSEAGTRWGGTVKSAVGIGALLVDGIGDTIRVSLTADPIEEVRVGWTILAALGLRRRGPDLISCPTCGRTEIDIVGLAEAVERRLQSYDAPITVAVMGCRVNGPEEARHADFGVAGGAGEGVLFARGERIATVPEEHLLDELFALIDAEVRPESESPLS